MNISTYKRYVSTGHNCDCCDKDMGDDISRQNCNDIMTDEIPVGLYAMLILNNSPDNPDIFPTHAWICCDRTGKRFKAQLALWLCNECYEKWFVRSTDR